MSQPRSGLGASFAPLKTIVATKQLYLFYPNWSKTPGADHLPVFLSNLNELSIPLPNKSEVGIILKFTRLKQVFVDKKPLSFEEFKKRFGPKEKEAKTVKGK